jgi:hypothetical protein
LRHIGIRCKCFQPDLFANPESGSAEILKSCSDQH